MDDFQDPKTYEYTLLPLKNLGAHEDVWTHFCKLMKNGEVVGQGNVFCTRCLDNGICQSYSCLCSINVLRQHLMSEHGITGFQDLTDMSEVVSEINLMAVDDVIAETLADPNKELQQIDCIEYLDSTELIEDTSVVDTSRKTSGAWKFFTQIYDEKEDAEYMYCNFCIKTKEMKRYKSSTATTNLLKHLKKQHSKEMAEYSANFVSAGKLSPIKRAFIKTSDVWKYFCKLTKNDVIVDEDYVYCGKCLEENIKKKYRKTTSTSSLKQHLQMYHDIVLDEVIEALSSGKDSQSKCQGNKISKVRTYFKKLKGDVYHYYCLFCLKDNYHQKYRITTSTSSLKNHLLSKHNFDPDINACPDLSIDEDNLISKENQLTPVADSTEEQTLILNEELNNLQAHFNEDDLIEVVETLSEEEYEPSELQESQQVQLDCQPGSDQHKTQEIVELYCRSCGKNPDGCHTKLSNQFEDEETTGRTLHDLYYEVTGVKTCDSQNLSQMICYECEAKLKFAFKFRQLALKTEMLMFDRIGAYSVENVEEDESFIEEIPEAELKQQNYELLEAVIDEESKGILDENNLETYQDEQNESVSKSAQRSVKRKGIVSKRRRIDDEVPLEDGVLPVPVNALQIKPATVASKSSSRIKLLAAASKLDEESDTELSYCEFRFSPDTDIELCHAPALTCSSCQFSFEHRDLLLLHNQELHYSELPHKAECRKRFATKHELELHNNFMHEKRSCLTCNIIFVNQQQLDEHSSVHSVPIMEAFQLFKCTECDVVFSNETSHSLHMVEHSRYYNCEHCAGKFKKKAELNVHKRRRHRFICDTCGNSFATQNILEVHKRSHTGSRPYSCNMCDKCLISADALKVHLKYVHNAFGSTAKTCKICNKTFNSKNGFFRHNRIHTGELFVCEEAGCGKKFTGRSVLKKHVQLVHHDVRAYQCSKCSKRYKSNAHLTKHVETEHLKLKFLCPVCNKTISNRWDFNYHVKRNHPDQLDTKAVEIRPK